MTEDIKRLLKVYDRRTQTVTGSVGVYDIYKRIRKGKWAGIESPVTEREFYSVIRTVSGIMAERLSEGKEVILPHRMGSLDIRKYRPVLRIRDGRLVNRLPVDWKRTLELWSSDTESLERRTLVRHESREVFKLVYDKSRANYNNKSFMEFRFNRNIKKALRDNIRDNKIDAFTL